MLTERGKTALILFLAVSALSIVILFLLFDRFGQSVFGKLFFEIGLTRWGWIYALVLATSAIVGTLAWKPDSLALFLFVIIVAVIVLICSSYWLFMIYVVTHLKP
jgi:cobalamin synthase